MALRKVLPFILMILSYSALAEIELFLWDNEKALVKPQGCSLQLKDESQFKVIQSQEEASHSVPLKNVKNETLASIPNGSLMRILTKKITPIFQASVIIGHDKKSQKDRLTAKRFEKGFVRSNTLMSLSDFVMQINLNDLQLGLDKSYAKSFLFPLKFQNKFISYRCNQLSNRDYILFGVALAEDTELNMVIAVSPMETFILKEYFLINRAEVANLPVANDEVDPILVEPREELDLRMSTSLSRTEKNTEEESVPREVAIALEEDMVSVEVSENIIYDEVPKKYSPVDYLPSQDLVVCTGGSTLSVRPEHSRAKSNPKLRMTDARNGEAVKVIQHFDFEDVRKIDGKSYDFIEIELINREGTDQRRGWVAKDFIKPISECESVERRFIRNPMDTVKNINDSDCCEFPTRGKPTSQYKDKNRAASYGSNRSNGKRKHAACDLYRPQNEKVLAIAPGVIVEAYTYFYLGTYAVVVKHEDGSLARYGELSSKSFPEIKVGNEVKMGQPLGKIKQIRSKKAPPMLHFELFKGGYKHSFPLSLKPHNKRFSEIGKFYNMDFQRRNDLMNPTEFLTKWEQGKFSEE